MTFIDHMTVITENIAIDNKHCEHQVVWIVFIINNYVKKTSIYLVSKTQNMQVLVVFFGGGALFDHLFTVKFQLKVKSTSVVKNLTFWI